MNYQGLRCVLAILRTAESQAAPQMKTPIEVIGSFGLNGYQDNTFRIAALLSDNIQRASTEVSESVVPEEIKTPILTAIDILLQGFSLTQLTSPLGMSLEMRGVYVGYISIVLRNLVDDPLIESPPEAASLAAEIEEFSLKLDLDGLDPSVALLLKKKLVALATLVSHIPVFGMDEALATYWDIVFSVHRAKSAMASAPTSSPAVEPAKSLSARLPDWLGRLKQIDQAVAVGKKLVEHASDAVQLLTHLPLI